MKNKIDLKSKIREVPNWPKEGVNFKDVTTLLQDSELLIETINRLGDFLKDKKIDKIVGIDARGFIFATPVAYNLNIGLSIVRKKGKLPFETIEKDYDLEYASNTIEMHKDAVLDGENVVLIDDLCATGGTAVASCDLIEQLGGKIVGVYFVVDLPFLEGSKKLKERGYEVKSLVNYDSE